MPDQYFSSAILPNGVTVRRGDACLLEYQGHVCTALVDMIGRSDDDYYVTAAIITGKPAWTYDGAGYRHVSSPHISGKRFCLISEGDAAEKALREHFQLVSTEHGPMSDERTITPQPPAPKSPVVFETSAADLNADGVVTAKEQKQFERQQRKQQ